MRNRNIHTKRTLQTIQYVCSVLFALFSIVYLYCFQSNLLAQEQFYFSHGQTTYNALLGALLLTFGLLLLGLLFQRVLRLSSSFQAVAWMPSCYILGVLTMMTFSNIPTDTQQIPYFMLVAIPILFILLLSLSKILLDVRKGVTLRNTLPSNLFLMFLMFLSVGMMGNSSVLFHYEMNATQLAKEGRYSDALKVAEKSTETTPLLSASRAFSLSKLQKLGDNLFHYPMPSTSRFLLPEPADTLRVANISSEVYSHLGVYPLVRNSFSPKHFLNHAFSNDTLRSAAIIEYLLCAHLLDADLNSFAEICVAYKDTSAQSTIEMHYKEALLLYENQTEISDSFPCINDSIRKAFEDFLFTKDTLRNNLSIKENCKRKYGDTYWFHYYFSH